MCLARYAWKKKLVYVSCPVVEDTLPVRLLGGAVSKCTASVLALSVLRPLLRKTNPQDASGQSGLKCISDGENCTAARFRVALRSKIVLHGADRFGGTRRSGPPRTSGSARTWTSPSAPPARSCGRRCSSARRRSRRAKSAWDSCDRVFCIQGVFR